MNQICHPNPVKCSPYRLGVFLSFDLSIFLIYLSVFRLLLILIDINLGEVDDCPSHQLSFSQFLVNFVDVF